MSSLFTSIIYILDPSYTSDTFDIYPKPHVYNHEHILKVRYINCYWAAKCYCVLPGTGYSCLFVGAKSNSAYQQMSNIRKKKKKWLDQLTVTPAVKDVTLNANACLQTRRDVSARAWPRRINRLREKQVTETLCCPSHSVPAVFTRKRLIWQNHKLSMMLLTSPPPTADVNLCRKLPRPPLLYFALLYPWTVALWAVALTPTCFYLMFSYFWFSLCLYFT